MILKFSCDLGNVCAKTWSGTTKAVFDRIGHDMISAVPLEYDVNKRKCIIFRIVEDLYKKLFFYWDKNAVGYEKEWHKFLEEGLADADGLFFFSHYVIGSEVFPNKKFFIYLDCELNYEQKFLRRRILPGKEWFLHRYNHNVSRSLMNTQLIFTMNEWTAREIIRCYSIPKEKVINVGFGVNSSFLEEEKTYDNNLLLIVLRKGTERYKGLHLLLKAFKQLHQRNKGLRLAVVGTDVGMTIDGVECYYNQPREVTLRLFREATLYVMPSLCEPNGITYLEALANKTPIVGLNRFAFPEFAGYGKYGFIVEEENSDELVNVIENALADKEHLAKMGADGQAFVRERYNWDIVCDKMYKQIKEQIK